MATTQKLELRQTTSLSLTPQLRQAISLLQMSNIELQEFLEQEVEKNPLLDVPPIRESDASWTSSSSSGYSNIEDISKTTERVKPLREYLAEQIRQQERNEAKADLACHLVDELDENGFLQVPNFELSDRYGVPQSNIEDALELVQSCDPPGIGARNLAQCLLLQLREQNLLTPAHLLVVENLGEVAKGDLANVSRKTKIPVRDIEEAYRNIKLLNPKPTSEYEPELLNNAPPDVIVTKAPNGNWRVELNAETLPKVIVNEEYAAEIAENGKEAKIYIHKLRNDARFLLKAVDTRAKTLLNVATYIVQFQSKYFVSGVSALLPLKLSDIAEKVGVSESTVSRVTKGKYLYSPQGMKELSYFLSGGMVNRKDNNAIATTAIMDKIAKAIAQESKENRLTDEDISQKLSELGLQISRRTVSKYRQKLGIRSSNQRAKLGI